MLDNLRDSASSSFFDDDDDDLPDFLEEEEKVTPIIPRKQRTGPFLGLSPMQRFVLSAMLFFTVCVIGALFVLVFGRVMLPSF